MSLNVDIAAALAAVALYAPPGMVDGAHASAPIISPTCSFGYVGALLIDFETFPAYRHAVRRSETGTASHFFSATELSAYREKSANPIIEQILQHCDPYRESGSANGVAQYMNYVGDGIYYNRYGGFIEAFAAFEGAPLQSEFFDPETDSSPEDLYGLNHLQIHLFQRVAALIRSEARLKQVIKQGDHEGFPTALDQHVRNLLEVDSDGDISSARSWMWPPGFPDGLYYMGEFFRSYAVVNLIDILAERVQTRGDWPLSEEEASSLAGLLGETGRFKNLAGNPPANISAHPDSEADARRAVRRHLTAMYPVFVHDLLESPGMLPSYEYSPFLWARSRQSAANLTHAVLDRERDIGAYPTRMCFVEANLQLAESVFVGTVFNPIPDECPADPDFPPPHH